MSKWVISLSGVKGQGPWEHRTSTGNKTAREAKTLGEAYIWYATDLASGCLSLYRANGHPHAKVFRLVRRGKLPCVLTQALKQGYYLYICPDGEGRWEVECARPGKSAVAKPRVGHVATDDVVTHVTALLAARKGVGR